MSKPTNEITTTSKEILPADSSRRAYELRCRDVRVWLGFGEAAVAETGVFIEPDESRTVTGLIAAEAVYGITASGTGKVNVQEG